MSDPKITLLISHEDAKKAIRLLTELLPFLEDHGIEDERTCRFCGHSAWVDENDDPVGPVRHATYCELDQAIDLVKKYS
jgi:predicted amidohydrolase